MSRKRISPQREWRGPYLLDFILKWEAANGETIHGCLQMVDLARSKKLDHSPYNNHTLTRSLEASLGKDTNEVSNYYYYLEASLVWPIKNGILKDDNGAERGLCELAIEELFDLMKPDRDYITWSVRVKKLVCLILRTPPFPLSLLDFKLKGEAVNGETIHGCLQMVDLAGSKKLDVPTGESNFIRSGLLFLDMVIEALSTNQQHIPYNNHTLTRSLEA
ncbi:kinesin-like protein KIN-14L [Tanacetum coccineum]